MNLKAIPESLSKMADSSMQMCSLQDVLRTGDNLQNYFTEVTVNYKQVIEHNKRIGISSSGDAYDVLRKLWSDRIDHVEEFVILLLDRANCLLGWSHISTGGISGCVADLRVIFQTSLKANATSIIAAHNHPSGNLKPSESDLVLTRKIKESDDLMDIKLLDHLIISNESYYSFSDEGII